MDLQGLKKFKTSKGRIVGPFHLLHPLTEEDFMVALFIFTLNRRTCDVLIKYRKIDTDHDRMKCMKPEGEIFGRIITCYSRLLMYEECKRAKQSRPKYWYMPSDVSRAEAALEMLHTLDTLLELEIKMAFGEGFNFANFAVNHVEGILQEDNGKDYGIFVKFMEHFSSKEEQMDQENDEA
ncbi:hypothetical protein PanWU01x14_338860 [Parasponia andersonii]|uniref:Uncharacterized protein n=1 Tax=Parasponia andersonii TaxID=3476 RepID=A0A2P5AF01_PARAD|nr:hypothetical protein PanWU01x14_338860 [Parasponia andersonii]